MYQQRIKHLEEAHRMLDLQIKTLTESGNYNDSALSELKKKKLLYKDEIRNLTRQQWEYDHDRVDFDDN